MGDESMLIDGAIILVLLIISAFFSSSETALTAITRTRIFQLIQDGHKGALLIEKLREVKESLIGAILLGNNLVNIASASLATILAIKLWGAEYGPLYATIIMTVLVLIFAEVLPKTIAINYAEQVALLVSRPIAVVVKIFSPVTNLVQWFIRLLLKPFGLDLAQSGHSISATEYIRGAIELHHSEGHVEKKDRDMLGSILDLNDREVHEVMIHRKNVYAIDLSQEPEDIIEQVIASAHSRIPLWKDNTDNIVGILHVKDMMRLMRDSKIGITREMIRRAAQRPWFVPDTTILSDQLIAFRSQRKHFACVVDEYGAFMGIVTLEDIIEEIVGDIDDEHDEFSLATIMPFGKHAYRVEGTTTIRDLNRHLDWDLPDEDAATVAGLILHEARVIPEEGALFELYGYRITVTEKTANQITLLTIEPLELDDADENAA